MKLGLLGLDAEMLEVAQSAAEAGHELVAIFDVPPPLVGRWTALAPDARELDAWEALLSEGAIEAILISRAADDEVRADQLRVLVQSGLPLLIAHPVHHSMLVYYELDMIRKEADPVMLPCATESWHPAVERLAEMARNHDGLLGRVEQLVFERSIDDRTRTNVLAHFVRDLAVLRPLVGSLTKIGAMAADGGSADFHTLSLQMTGPDGPLVRWSVLPAVGGSSGRLTVIGTKDKATLHLAAGDDPWRLELPASAGPIPAFDDWDPGHAALEHFTRAIACEAVRPTWIDACRDMELADALERSLKKGRTIDLFYEEQTEHGTFKGIMAASGCALLIAALVLAIVATTAVNLGVPLARLWPYLLLAALVTFLLVQFLKLAFPRDE